MFRLNRLGVKGFKSIREMDLELGALNVLIGPNGAGKSNLLSVFRLLGAVVTQGMQLFVGRDGGANAHLYYGRKRTPALEIEVHYGDGLTHNTYGFTLAAAAADDFVFEREVFVSASGTGVHPLDVGAGHRESRLREAMAAAQQQTADALDWSAGWSFRHYHFHDTSASAPLKQRSLLQNNRALQDDAGNLAAFLHLLKHAHPAHYQRIRDTVRLAAPFFDDFVLEPQALDPNTILLEWRERGSDMPFFAYHLSDGTLRLIALATALLQPELPGRPRTIVIDEPELGLHPYAITLLASMMRAASQHTQLIVSTQSVTLLDALAAPEEVVVVDRKGPESTFRRLDPEALSSWLEAYTLGELWEKNVLGGRP